MKLTAETKNIGRLTFMSLFLATALAAGLHTPQLHAQDDMLDEADDALQMDDINLEGKISPSERLRQRRERLEERNKIMVEKKIEDIRVKQEIALTNKLQDAFGKSLNNLNEDKVQVQQAAPVAVAPQPVVAPAPVVETKIIEVEKPIIKEEKKSKVIPFLGAQSIKGDKTDFETKMSIGASVETFVLDQVTAGLGIGYSTMDITDTANAYLNNGSVIGSGYYSSFSGGRKMAYDKITLEANSKFFLTVESRVKPFAGLGLSYNRSNLKYEDNGNGYNFNGVTYGSEGFSSTSMAATAKLGAEVDFSETVGLNIDLSYTKTLSSGISNKSDVGNSNPDQVRLQNVTKSIEDSDITSIAAGLIVRF